MWAMVKATEEEKWSHSRVNSFLASYLAGSQAPRSQLELKGGEQRGCALRGPGGSCALLPHLNTVHSLVWVTGKTPLLPKYQPFLKGPGVSSPRGQVTRNGPVRFSKEAKSQRFLRNCLFLKCWSLVQFFQSTPWAKLSPPP